MYQTTATTVLKLMAITLEKKWVKKPLYIHISAFVQWTFSHLISWRLIMVLRHTFILTFLWEDSIADVWHNLLWTACSILLDYILTKVIQWGLNKTNLNGLNLFYFTKIIVLLYKGYKEILMNTYWFQMVWKIYLIYKQEDFNIFQTRSNAVFLQKIYF